MTVTAIVGLQWGDEGKGKITDFLGEEGFDITVRFQGGNNAGHTIKPTSQGKSIDLHYIPSGVITSEKVVLADGMVISPYSLAREVESLKTKLKEQNLFLDPWDKMLIGENTPMTLDWHIIYDALETAEQGTTISGIAPTYSDEDLRICPTFGFLGSGEALKRQLKIFFEKKQKIFDSNMYSDSEKANAREKVLKRYGSQTGEEIWKSGTGFDAEEETGKLTEIYEKYLNGKIINTKRFLDEAYDAGKSIMFEGAQGFELDKKYGIKGRNTSSHTTIQGIGVYTGFDTGKIDRRIGVVKTYCSRVGGTYDEVPTWIGEHDLGKINALGFQPTEKDYTAKVEPSLSLHCTSQSAHGMNLKTNAAQSAEQIYAFDGNNADELAGMNDEALQKIIIKQRPKPSLSVHVSDPLTSIQHMNETMNIKKGGEFGTTTGRVRGVGWLDLVKLARAIEVNEINELAFTKGDVLGGLSKVKICVAYDFNGQKTAEHPINLLEDISRCKPIYKEMKGWASYTDDEWAGMADKGFAALPENMQKYYKNVLLDLYKITGKEMGKVYISVSPRRGAVAILDKKFLKNEIYF